MKRVEHALSKALRDPALLLDTANSFCAGFFYRKELRSTQDHIHSLGPASHLDNYDRPVKTSVRHRAVTLLRV